MPKNVNSAESIMKKFLMWYRRYKRVLLILLACTLIITYSYLDNAVNLQLPTETTLKSESVIKSVDIFTVGSNSFTTSAIATVENGNYAIIVSLMPGIISNIDVSAGDDVSTDTNLLAISSNYSDQSLADLQVDMAEKQLELAQFNLSSLTDTKNENIDLADESLDDFYERQQLSEIDLDNIKLQISRTEDTIDEIASIINNIDDFEDTINLALQNNEITPFQADQALLQNDLQKNQQEQLFNNYKTTLAQLESTHDLLEYQLGSNSPIKAISEITNELTTKQVETQIQIARLNVDLSEISLKVARANEKITNPESPLDGVIEKIYVRENQYINPGEPLMFIAGKPNPQLKVKIAPEIAENLVRDDVATITYKGANYKADIAHVANVPTDGVFHEVILIPEDSLKGLLRIGTSVKIKLPVLFSKNSRNNNLYIPLDSVHRSASQSYVFLISNGTTSIKQITTGEILGDVIHVLSGLIEGDLIVTDRDIQENIKVIPRLVQNEAETEPHNPTTLEDDNAIESNSADFSSETTSII